LGILRGIARFWGDPDGEICDACDTPITKQQLIMDGIVSTQEPQEGRSVSRQVLPV